MFFRRKPKPDSEHATYPGVPVTLETIDARLTVLEQEVARINRRWAPGHQRSLDAALAKLGEAISRDADIAAIQHETDLKARRESV